MYNKRAEKEVGVEVGKETAISCDSRGFNLVVSWMLVRKAVWV